MSIESYYYDLVCRIADDKGRQRPLSGAEIDLVLWEHTGFPFAGDFEIVEQVGRFFGEDPDRPILA